MKRLLMILLGLLLFVIIAVAVFLATFDADRFRPQLVAALEKATGQPVTLERISLNWRGGFALQLKGLTIADGAAPTQPPLLRVDQANAVVRLMPLLRREVQVAAVTLIRPEVRISRDKQGRINLVGLAVAGSPAAAASPTAAPSAGTGAVPAIAIQSVKITDGQLRWADALNTPLAELAVRDIDVTLQNIKPAQPFDFEARFALFSEHQDVTLSGRAALPAPGQATALERLRLEVDLGRMNWTEVRGAFPAIQQAGIKQVEGLLQVVVERLVLSPEGLAKAVARVQMKNGRKELAGLPQPIEGITLEATLAQGRLDLKQALARVAEGTLKVSGTLEGLGQPVVRSTFTIALENVPLELLQPHPQPEDPYVRGRCTVTLEGRAEGPLNQLVPTFSGQGHLRVQEPVLVNLNILREVFQKLSILPGLMPRLQSRLPEEYQQKFEAKDTVFESLASPLRLQEGVIRFDALPLRTDSFSLDNTGFIALQGGVNIRAMLTLDAPLSAALIRSVEELKYLTTAGGELQLPIAIQGQAPRVAVVPDIGYVASRLVVTKVQDLLGELLQKQEPEATP